MKCNNLFEKSRSPSLWKFAAVSCFLLFSGMISGIARADLLQNIKDKGTIVIGTEARYAPFEFIEHGEIVGYDRDLLVEIMKGLPGVKVETHDLPFQGILPGLSQGKLDFVVTAVSVTNERYEKYAMTSPIADATVAFAKRANDNTIKKPEDVVGKIVGTQTGTGQLLATQDFDKKLKKKFGKGMAGIKEYVSFDEVYADLTNRRIDVAAQSLPPLLYLQKQHPDKYKVIEPPFGPKFYFSWAGRKDNGSKSLVEFFNKRIIALRGDGTMKKLQEKWFGFAMETPDVLPKPTL